MTILQFCEWTVLGLYGVMWLWAGGRASAILAGGE